MHPFMGSYISNLIYLDQLKNGIRDQDRQLVKQKRLMMFNNLNKPTMFVDVGSYEQNIGNGFICNNYLQAMELLKYTKKLLMKGVNPEQIGIIAMYRSQVFLLRKYIFELPQPNYILKKVKISTVDSFQGSEMDFILISTVRSNRERNIGFLKNLRRINVAISRAKEGMIIFGNSHTLSRSKFWADLIQHYKDELLYKRSRRVSEIGQ